MIDDISLFVCKDIGGGKGTAKGLVEKIATMESEAQKSFMHRSVISDTLICSTKTNVLSLSNNFAII